MSPDDASLKDRYALARRIAVEVGDVTLRFFQQKGLMVDSKEDGSPVTEADRQAEALLRKRILESFPDDGIVGEEHGLHEGTSSWRWIVDPIDGTKSFISGVPLYGTLVGVEHEGENVIGVIHIPPLAETVHASRGGGAWHELRGQTTAAQVGSFDSLADGLLLTTEIGSFHRREAGKAWDQLERKSERSRTWGDCYGYLLVATGRAAAMIDPIANQWDISAVMPVIEEAGGRFTDWRGRPSVTSGDAIGAVPGVFDEILEVTKDFPPPSRELYC